MRTYITTLLLATTLILASCGGGNDVASSGATAVSAAAPTSTTTPTEAKLNGQIDERTGVAPVVAKMTISGSVNYYTVPSVYRSGNYYDGFYGPSPGGTLCSKAEASAKGAIIVCLNRPEQFANYTIDGVDYYTQFDDSKKAYTGWLASIKAFCGHGDSPNGAIQWCLSR